jgi:hypothetical protein
VERRRNDVASTPRQRNRCSICRTVFLDHAC